MQTVAVTDSSYFHPWVGSSYRSGVSNGIRLLILGESHYAKPNAEEQQMTRKVITDQLSGISRQGFLTRLERLVIQAEGITVDSPSAVPFWERVIFYNYVQELVGEQPRIRPSEGAWERAVPFFRCQLETHRPHAVLVCGRALWDHLKSVKGLTTSPHGGENGSDVRSRTLLVDACEAAVAAPINHPSSRGFRRKRWIPVVEALLQRARTFSHT